MNWKRIVGLDTLGGQYAYGHDPRHGYVSASKIADRWVDTTCGYCSVGCGMTIGTRDGKAVAVRGNPSHPVNRGKLCPKGLSEHYTMQAKNRALRPLLHGKPVSWDVALDTMAAKFRAVQRKHGPDSLGVISTGQLVTEEFYTLGKLVQLGFGTKNYDGNTTLCMASAVSGYKRSFGSDGPPGEYADLEHADLIFLIGANIADNHPILCARLERNKKATLIVADPRVTKTAMLADIYLPVKPRSDIALLNGIAHILIRDGLIDREYIEAHTAGFAELEVFLRKFTPGHVASVTGLGVETIEHAAVLYGRAKAAFIGWTMGVNHSTQGAETVSAINNLALLTGQIGRAGAAPFSITGQCNAMGSREASFTSSLPGYRKFESEKDRAELAALWNVPVERIPASRGCAYPDIVEGAVAERIKALWIIATNPVVSFPNYDVLKQAFENLEFLVVQDGFHPTPTTELAHLVLPAAVWGEKEGTYTNSERRVSKVNKAVDPPAEARSDFDIFLAVADKLGVRAELFPGWTSTRDAFDEWKRVSAGRLCDYSAMTWERIEEEGGIQWGGERLYRDGRFQTEDGRAKLFKVECDPFPEQPNRDFPLILNTGRTVEHWHTRTKTGQVAILDSMSPRAWLEMNPRDAKRLGLKAHDDVSIVSRRSRVEGVELRVTEIVAPGQIFMPFHFAETNVNRATQSAFDPISREPNFKQCSVRVERTKARTS
ncbi:MAG: nitrate reductase [Acidobacteriota bacterium]|nr:nitrate reductase [Acidobacteriota bacterium]